MAFVFSIKISCSGFLLCLYKLDLFSGVPVDSLVFYVIDKYFKLTWYIQEKYSLEPAGGRKLTVVLDYYEALEPYSRIGLIRCDRNLQSYWTTTKL